MPRVSVILPNYNYARYLEECARSALSQTMRDLELLYYDDGSQDASNAVMRRVCADDPRVSMHCCERNSGHVYSRWNEAAAQAQGEWLWFLGADDAAHPRFLESTLVVADAHPTAAIVHTPPLLMDSTGKLFCTLRAVHPEVAPWLTETPLHIGPDAVAHMVRCIFLSTATALLIRREAFLAANGFDLRFAGFADIDLYLRLLHTGDIAYLDVPLAYFRKHGGSATDTGQAGAALVRYELLRAACTAGACARMRGDGRYPRAVQQAAVRGLRSQVFDLFALPDPVIPADLDWAAQAVYEFAPDKRLCRTAPAALTQVR